jgi:hypothetical protein
MQKDEGKQHAHQEINHPDHCVMVCLSGVNRCSFCPHFLRPGWLGCGITFRASRSIAIKIISGDQLQSHANTSTQHGFGSPVHQAEVFDPGCECSF